MLPPTPSDDRFQNLPPPGKKIHLWEVFRGSYPTKRCCPTEAVRRHFPGGYWVTRNVFALVYDKAININSLLFIAPPSEIHVYLICHLTPSVGHRTLPNFGGVPTSGGTRGANFGRNNSRNLRQISTTTQI